MRVAHDGFAVVVNFAGNTARAEGLVTEIDYQAASELCTKSK